ncbi:MAG: M48 family metallopeptidase [Alphaproteobacteria bacterium]|nr:M48 family metallopeptidase [Alphaproteobacteria bacterium]
MKITLLTGKTFDIAATVGMDIKVVPSRSCCKLTLKIDEKERIPVLSVPRLCSQKQAVNFVNEHMDWIVKALNKLPEVKYFVDGEVFLLFGQSVTIEHHPEAHRGVWLENDKLCVSGESEFIHRRVKDYIKKCAKENFYNRSLTLAQKIEQKLTGVSIKDTSSRWGSCSTLHHINYSWRIALAPDFVIDYLMAHEVSHLKHPDHSDAFWACVADLCPEWSNGRIWLKRYGKTLYAYK